MKKTECGGASSVSRMLSDLNLAERYSSAFQSAAVDDAMLDDILMMMKGDEDDKSEAKKGIEEIVKLCGLVGGSAAKVRKYLETGGKRAGGVRAGVGAVAYSKGGKKKKNDGHTTKSTKKANDLSSLERTLGGSGTKTKGRRKKATKS